MNKKLFIAVGMTAGLAIGVFVATAGIITYQIIKDNDPYLYHHVYKGI